MGFPVCLSLPNLIRRGGPWSSYLTLEELTLARRQGHLTGRGTLGRLALWSEQNCLLQTVPALPTELSHAG